MQGGARMWTASCSEHQWAVKDGNPKAVEALIREHVREHPTVHSQPVDAYMDEYWVVAHMDEENRG